MHARNFLKIRYFERGLSKNCDYEKAVKKLTLFFLSNLVPVNRPDFEKQNGPGTSDHLLFRLYNKVTQQKNSFINEILYNQVW